MGNLLSSAKSAGPPSLLQPALEGKYEALSALLTEEGCVVDATDPQGNTALHAACCGGHVECMKALLERGADHNNRNDMGCSPIWLCAGYGHLQPFLLLADEYIKNVHTDLFRPNNNGDTPLLAAASRGHAQICKELLKTAKAANDVGSALQANKNNETPLSVASASGHTAVVDVLLEELGEDATSLVNAKNKIGIAPISIACERGHAAIVASLLKAKADVSQEDSNGAIALSVAAFCGQETTVKAVVEASKQAGLLEHRDGTGCTPLWLAAAAGHTEAVKILLEAGADRTAVNKDNVSCGEAARKNKHDAVADLLV